MDQGELQETYGRDYFHGIGSGYDRHGYAQGHQDWSAWLEFLKMLKPSGGRLVDLGCAYGYLPGLAADYGFQGVGLDISSFALSQEPGLRKSLAQAHLQRLPLCDCCADVVCLFDVLEHLEDPLEALREAARILRPGGFLVGATPDPVYFNRKEPTHCFERPPSFWVAALESLGLEVSFRFSVEAYNFQFLASLPGSREQLGLLAHDYFSQQPDFIQTQGELIAVPRAGWGPLDAAGARPMKPQASLYLLNRNSRPLRTKIRLSASANAFTTLRLRWNSFVLAEIQLSSDGSHQDGDPPEFILPAGGHHLFLETIPQQDSVRIRQISLRSLPAEPAEAALRTPFDLFQRYRLAAIIAAQLHPESILDYGGVIGDRDGHIATLKDFLGESFNPRIATHDVRQCDHPHHIPASHLDTNPEASSFDLVLCLDVLEHIPGESRLGFLQRMDHLASKWILLGAPFDQEQVRRAEELLRQELMATRRFLREHEELGLPQTDLVESFCRDRRYSFHVYPNGYLPRWIRSQALTQHYFSQNDYLSATLFNRIANGVAPAVDARRPAYRLIYLIGKKPLQDSLLARIEEAIHRPQEAEGPSREIQTIRLHERLGRLLEGRRKALDDAYFLMNEREEHIRLLLETEKVLREKSDAPLHRIVRRRLRGDS